jgi:HD-like signal output (HDOD) protein
MLGAKSWSGICCLLGRFMTTKSILLALAEPQKLADITQELGAEWETISASNEANALAHLQERSFDALLVDFNLGSPDASELMNHALNKRSETIRFLLAHEADLALVAAKVLGSPHILPKSIEPGPLKSRIDNALKESLSRQSGAATTEGSSDSPAVPTIYTDVLAAIESLGVSDAQVGDIIARDPALTLEVLRLTNSAYLGLPRNITEPGLAVESLGLETIKALVMALQFLAEHSRLKPGYLSLDQIWQHSVNVGQIARDLILFETKDRTLAGQALIAGILHDLGKVVLVTNFDDLYGRVHSLARKQPVTLWDIEKEMFGANHGEIGACLAGMWNMPSAIVEATAFHHEPVLSEHEQFTPLAAVHIANVLERELYPSDDDMMVAPIIDTTFLNQLGLLQRLPVWRAAFANRRPVDLEPEAQSAETDQSGSTVVSGTAASRTANQLPAPASPTQTTTSGRRQSGVGTSARHPARHTRTWVYAGASGILVLLALWFRTQLNLSQPEQAYARTPAPHQPAAVAGSSPAPTIAPTPAPQVPPTVTVAEEPPTPTPSSETIAKPAAPLAEPPIEPTAASATVTNVPHQSVASATVTPEPKAQPDFRLNGIIYTSVRPSAIVNGQTVKVGDQVNGATVVGITRTSVTLQIKGQHRTFELPM